MHLLCGSYFAQIAIKSNEKEWFHFEKKNNCWENETEKNASLREKI